VPAALDHVGDVVCVCPDEKVLRVAADRPVAPVTDMPTTGRPAVRKRPCDAVSAHGHARRDHELPVPRRRERLLPVPALVKVTDRDLLPESRLSAFVQQPEPVPGHGLILSRQAASTSASSSMGRPVMRAPMAHSPTASASSLLLALNCGYMRAIAACICVLLAFPFFVT